MTYPTFAVSNKEKTRVLAVATPNRLPQFPIHRPSGNWVSIGSMVPIAASRCRSQRRRRCANRFDLFLKINSDPEHRKQMQDGGYEQIDITHDQVGDFMKKRAPRRCRWPGRWDCSNRKESVLIAATASGGGCLAG